MSRTLTLVLGVLLWGSFAIVALRHVESGDGIVPALAILIVTSGVVIYHARRRAVRARAS